MIKRALLSVSDKSGIIELAQALAAAGIEILSTGGTAQLLASRQIPVTEVASVTGFPEMLDGRVKTLHPKIHGGLLGRRDLETHVRDMQTHGIQPIDLLVVNLYPFVETIARPGCTLEDAIENIDIGGPAMIRAAAKNYPHVAVVTDPADYPRLLAELQANQGATTADFRFQLATKAFTHTARYDGAISNYLSSLSDNGQRQPFPGRLNLAFDKVQDLRYGENPHQAAAFYREPQPAPGSLATHTQLQGKELSYNNLADADAAWECVKSFERPACVIVKHANPCGVAEAATLAEAYQRALATDRDSAFGGIVAFNQPLDEAAARAATQLFVEVILAPGVSEAARTLLAAKPNIRVLTIPLAPGANPFDLKRVGGGLLVQTPDIARVSEADLKVVTRKAPDAQQLNDLLFAFRVAKFVKSNAIVFARSGQTLGLGAGQMSRVDSTRIAVMKAAQAQLSLAGAVVASEAFLPFRDNIDVLAAAGASAVIQPGGSVRDQEVIDAANAAGIAMVFTGVRHFRH